MNGEHHFQLPKAAALRLEQLRQLTGKQSIAEALAVAVDLFACLRASAGFPCEQLTPRTREVLRLVAEGISTREIAARLKISVKTVEFHRARLKRKLGIRGIAGLVRYAIRAGLILP